MRPRLILKCVPLRRLMPALLLIFGFGAARADNTPDGIWKAVVPPVNMHGEFGGYDPIGLANKQWIKADCSINWTDPDTHKLYCFSVSTSMAYFLQWPKANEARARQVWDKAAPTQ
jgi:hypothetical protein